MFTSISDIIDKPVLYKGHVIRVTLETMPILLKGGIMYNLETLVDRYTNEYAHLSSIDICKDDGFSWYGFLLDQKVSGFIKFSSLLPYDEKKGGGK